MAFFQFLFHLFRYFRDFIKENKARSGSYCAIHSRKLALLSHTFDSLQKEFLGALPSGFEGVKNLALQKVERITPLAGVQPFANTQGKLLLWVFF